MANTKFLNIGCTTQALYNQGPGALSYKQQATSFKLDMKDSIGYIVTMQASPAAQCERSGSGINTMIKPGLQVGPGIPSSLIFIFSLLKSQASSSKLQAPRHKHQASSHKQQAHGPRPLHKVSSSLKRGSRQV